MACSLPGDYELMQKVFYTLWLSNPKMTHHVRYHSNQLSGVFCFLIFIKNSGNVDRIRIHQNTFHSSESSEISYADV